MIKRLVIKYIKKKFEQGDPTIQERTDINVIRNLHYIEDKNRYHTMEILYPKQNVGQLPVLFNIHGGGWIAGDKEVNHKYASYLASKGYCVINISYRLIPNTNLKGQIQDIFKAIEYTRNLDLDIPWDKEKWFFIGDSAGGHLSAFVYCLLHDQELQDLYEISLEPFPVKGLILENMISDLSIMEDSHQYLFKSLANLLIGKKSNLYHKASFLEVIHDKIPPVPVFLVGSEIDDLCPQTIKMEKYLKEHDWYCDSIIWKKEDGEKLVHVFQVCHPYWEESEITHQRIIEFIQEVCL